MRLVVNGAGYNVECAGEGEPLVLLHGFTGSAASWASHLAGLEKNLLLFAIDFLGHGKSDVPQDAERYGMRQTVGDLAALLDELDIERANVLGYSMGGRVALHFAYAFPERVKRLVLESASPGLETETERTERAASDEASAERIEREGINWFSEYWTNLPLFATQSDAVRKDLKRQRLENNARGLANSLRGLSVGLQESLWEHLPKIKIPTLLVTGELDTKFTGIGQQMANAMPNAQLKIVRSAGHMVHVEQPDAFDAIVREFLKEIGD